MGLLLLLLLLTKNNLTSRNSQVQNQVNNGVDYEDANFGLKKMFGWWKWPKMYNFFKSFY